MSEELKACSYCGKQPQGNNWHTYGRNPKDEMKYFCANASCPGGFRKALTLDNWNTRPLEDALRAELATAREAIEYTLSQLEYMRMLWGGEGVTDGIAQRLRDALNEVSDEQTPEA